MGATSERYMVNDLKSEERTVMDNTKARRKVVPRWGMLLI